MKINLHKIPKYSFGYGPFSNKSYENTSKYMINKNILKENVLKSLKDSFLVFHKALKQKDNDLIKSITTIKFGNYLEQNFLKDFCNNKKINFDYNSKNEEIQLNIQNFNVFHRIHGLDMKNISNNDQKYGILDFVPGGIIKRLFYFKKPNFLNSCFFCDSLTFIEVVFESNLNIEFYEKNENLKKTLFAKYLTNEKNISTVQFITKTKYIKNEFPLISVENNEIKKKYTNESKQKDYENFGWKINNIDNYIYSETILNYII